MEASPRPTAPDQQLRERVARIHWFHSIPLRPDLITPGLDHTSDRLDVLSLPADLQGMSVLDVGAWDGFFSFEAERRGAARVVATDSFAWNGANWSTKEGFLLAREALGSSVEDLDLDVMDLSASATGTHDLVLMLGVLYHLRHPLLALERVAEVTAGRLVLETHVDLTWLRRPAMAFYPHQELNGDPTNWWGPNPSAVAGMLRAAGFRKVQMMTPDSTLYRGARAVRRGVAQASARVRGGSSSRTALSQGRAVFHAFK